MNEFNKQSAAAQATPKSNFRTLKVEVLSPCLVHQADAPYSTRMRARAMQSAGMDVEVFASPDIYPPAVGELGVSYCGVARVMAARTTRWVVALRRKFGNYWRFIGDPYVTMRVGLAHALKRGCDVVFIADVEPWVSFVLFAEMSLRRYPLPIIGMVPGNYGMPVAARASARFRVFLNYRFTKLLPKVIDVVGTSKHILTTLHIDQSRRAHVVPEGHEDHMDERPQAEARARLNLPLEERIVLLFGVAGRGKGADVLLSALELVSPNITVCIVGMTGDVYEPSWGSTERLEKAGWGKHLHIVSRYVSEEEMHDYYAACDAVVIPYKQGFAGTSTHLRRASEYGKAVLGCDQYHIGEQVRKYELGLTFETDNPDSLADCLRRFATLPAATFDQIRKNSQRLLVAESWENVGNMYQDLFESLLKRKSLH